MKRIIDGKLPKLAQKDPRQRVTYADEETAPSGLFKIRWLDRRLDPPEGVITQFVPSEYFVDDESTPTGMSVQGPEDFWNKFPTETEVKIRPIKIGLIQTLSDASVSPIDIKLGLNVPNLYLSEVYWILLNQPNATVPGLIDSLCITADGINSYDRNLFFVGNREGVTELGVIQKAGILRIRSNSWFVGSGDYADIALVGDERCLILSPDI